jgi:hypothetical protein
MRALQRLSILAARDGDVDREAGCAVEESVMVGAKCVVFFARVDVGVVETYILTRVSLYYFQMDLGQTYCELAH